MFDVVGEIVGSSVTLPFKLTIQGVKWICSGVKDIVDGVSEDTERVKLPKDSPERNTTKT